MKPELLCVKGVQGKRDYMEDADIFIEWDHPLGQIYFSAVFDGHGGDFISTTLASEDSPLIERLESRLKNIDLLDNEKTKTMLSLACQEANEELRSYDDGSGSTMIGMLCQTHNPYAYIINIGDSRACWRKGNKLFSTVDKSLENESERERIAAMGGHVKWDEDDEMYRLAKDEDSAGSLALARCFGDFAYKGVSVIPDVYILNIEDHDEIPFILACDGLWDEMKNVDVMNCYDRGLRCESIINAALRKGSTDNITMMIIHLQSEEYLVANKLDITPDEVRLGLACLERESVSTYDDALKKLYNSYY